MIRVRLLVGFILVSLLPVIGIGITTYIVSSQNGRQQSIDRLESVAARKELAIEVWDQSLQHELQIAATTEYSPKLVTGVLRLSNEGLSYSWYNELVRKRLQPFVDRSDQLEELFLVDLQGEIVVSTYGGREHKRFTDVVPDDPSLNRPYMQLPLVGTQAASRDPGPGEPDSSAAFVLIPVAGDDGKMVGAIGGKARIDGLKSILGEKTGLGVTGKAYLVNWDHSLVAGGNFSETADASHGASPVLVHTAEIDSAIRNAGDLAGTYTNPAGVPVVGIYRWIPDLKVLLSVEQNASEAFQAISANTLLNAGIAAIALILAILAALYMTKNIADPITNLANTAEQIAQGDLKRTAPVVRDDEVGALARAFNSMTNQLRDLIDSLERRVKERTQALQVANDALERRALQMDTSAKVGRQITSILDVDILLSRVVELIQEAFGYYHVQVFLLDREAGQLVLRASSGSHPVQHPRLDVGKNSMNGVVAQTGRLVLANDVSRSPDYLMDSGLSETRSELVVPLRLGEQVTGTLDVQSSTPYAFTNEDVLVIRGLADQIAVAIENARLYDQSKELAVLEERHRLARELHDSVTQSLYSLVLFTEGWRRTLNGRLDAQVDEYFNRIGEITQQSLKEMRLLIHELRPPALEEVGLVGALQKRLDAVEGRVGIEARVLMEDFVDLPVSLEQDLYHIAQEALNNALKHGRATRETVRISMQDSNVLLEVIDNGVGFDPGTAANRGGMGLTSMAERAKQIGGTLEIQSESRKGTVVKVSVPLVPAAVRGEA